VAGEVTLVRQSSIQVGGVSVTGRKTLPVSGSATFRQKLPLSTNRQIVKPLCTIAINKCQAVVADKDCTLKTNSTSGTPVEGTNDVLALSANVPQEWIYGDPDNKKFLTANVTVWYITCPADTTLTIIICDDPTPDVEEG
jgi:hypothetical protein